MRGKETRIGHGLRPAGITPAHAGKRLQIFAVSTAPRDHPRTCGEKEAKTWPKESVWGSPPHMRGKGCRHSAMRLAAGITPAHAGKSDSKAVSVALRWDHPRTCGEKMRPAFAHIGCAGSPPHMRGKVHESHERAAGKGITPAHAGKSSPAIKSAALSRDHPRTCGEK